ncbi:MAG: DUF2807 domain-containing protein [Flavobacteriaceae bacterium]|nr:DUF2807 domain-containing protein [Flavobacteriaceae bacterium]
MKTFLLSCLYLLNCIGYAQTNRTQEVGEFNEIKVYDLIEVNLIPSNEQKVIISGENTDDVKIINDDGTLKVRMELEERFDGNSTTVDVYYSRLDIIDANEGAEITSETSIEQNTLILRAQEGGSIDLDLRLENLSVKSVSGGSIEVSGTASEQEIKINTGGGFQGKELRTVRTVVKITAAGSAHVNASDRVTAKVTAGGSIYIYGSPEKVNESKLAGGKIVIVDE